MNIKHLSVAALLVFGCGPNPFDPLKCGGGPHSQVEASLSSVTLAQDCGGEAKGAADFAPGACAEGYACPSLCRQSSMQLAFTNAGKLEASVEIRAVRLIDMGTKKVLETLKSRDPQMWNADKYTAWNELVPGITVLKATYKLSAPSYNYPAAFDSNRSAYQPYSVEVDVAIDGQVRTLQAEATREPEVAT